MSLNNAKVRNFYDPLSKGYDRMMDAERRVQRATEFLQTLRQRDSFDSVIDAGCGSGHFAIAAARLGCGTLGIDLSEGMLDIARRTAQRNGVDIEWRQGSLAQVDQLTSAPADLVLCMGNTLPHVLDPDELAASCRAFFNALKPGGRAVVHLLNYDRLLATRERIVDIDRAGDLEFIRFYDYWGPNLINFNVLTIDWSKTPAKHQIESVELRPYRHQEVRQAMINAGFGICYPCGSLQLGPFHPHQSDVLILIAVKGRDNK